MEEVVFSNTANYGRYATVAVIATFGTACNAISLSFFLKHQKESLADKHLIFLNTTDLLICFLSPAALFCLSKAIVEGEPHLLLTIFAESFLSLSLLSCFITTILSVTRTLVLTKPLYMIRRNCVYLAHCINTIFSLVFIAGKIVLNNIHDQSEGTPDNIPIELYKILYAIQFLYVLVIVGIVGVSSVIVVTALRRPPVFLELQAGRRNNETNRKATVMILTLSIIFVILNGAWCVFWAICTILAYSNIHAYFIQILRFFAMFLSLFLIAINSFANPVVYMLRNSRLKNHTKALFRTFKRKIIQLTR